MSFATTEETCRYKGLQRPPRGRVFHIVVGEWANCGLLARDWAGCAASEELLALELGVVCKRCLEREEP